MYQLGAGKPVISVDPSVTERPWALYVDGAGCVTKAQWEAYIDTFTGNLGLLAAVIGAGPTAQLQQFVQFCAKNFVQISP